ncbi:PREDICTED: annexin A2-like [Cyprinodon variegatus]|uniref:Annexin A14 n=1 Tax=Cyprinodon variegatus TaxID=28743 RepID=A0A3Q2D6Q7_CYPVA|nr:PREDICTED: annexin A2-like [Cyprinodon variegatus]
MDPDSSSSDMWWGTLGTVRPFSNFHPERDVQEIQAALERKDAVTLVRILTNRSNAQRQVIAQSFEEQTKQDLSAALKKALSGDLEDLLLQLMMLPDQLEAHRLKDAMAGLGTDEETLLEILCTRSGRRLQEVSAVYKRLYKKDLEKELKAETSGDFAKLVVALLNKGVSTGGVQRDVQALAASLSGKKAEAGPWINILTSRDSGHLKKVLMELELETGQMVDQTVEKRFSGDFRLGLRVLVQCIQNPEVYLAQRLVTMKTSLVHGIMVSHSEEDLLAIRAAFLRLSGSSLFSALQNHFKGQHLQALQAVCRSED